VIVLSVSDLSIAFGGVRALDRVNFDVGPGSVFSIIGPNGAGKTTLFNIISGLYAPQVGRVRLAGDDVTGRYPEELARCGLSRTFQNLELFGRMTALDNVMVGHHRHERSGLFADLLHLPGCARENKRTRAAALAALDRVGLTNVAERPAASLPYGALKRLEIARALASGPRLLLLDEPAAGCNAVESTELEAVIRGLARDGITVLLVEHDMRLVMQISDRIHVLAHGRTLAEGNAEEVRTNAAVIDAYLGIAAQSRRSNAVG
jgi:branched-chain amino acid transport system ATP-binding protein